MKKNHLAVKFIQKEFIDYSNDYRNKWIKFFLKKTM